MWHNLGKVNVTKGSDVVTGVGTKWVENVRVGDAFQGPDGKLYQVVNVASDETLAISPAYEGSTAKNLDYWIVPIPGFSKTQADRLALIINRLDGDIAKAFEEFLRKDSNLADVKDKKVARDNLGLGTAATLNSGFSGGLVASSAKTAESVFYEGTASEPRVRYSFGGASGGWARGILNANLAADSQKYGGFWFGLLGSADNYTRGVIGFGNDSNWWQTAHQISIYPDKDPTVGTSNTIFHVGNILKSTGGNDGFPMSQKAVTDALSTKTNTTTQIIAGNGLTGGGSLAANRTLTLGTPSTITKTATNSVSPTSHTHELGADVKASLALADSSLQKNANLNDLTNKTTARSNLGLGSAATKNVGENAGNVMEVGAFGLSDRESKRRVDVDEVFGDIFSTVAAATQNKIGGRYGILISKAGWENKSGAQMFINYSSNIDFIAFRRYRDEKWAEWRELIHNGNLLQSTGSSAEYPMSQKAVTESITPIGYCYTQYPDTPTPSELFGGTWTLMFNTEGVFFRTEGQRASAFGSGVQGDAQQPVTGNITFRQLGDAGHNTVNSVSGPFSFGGTSGAAAATASGEVVKTTQVINFDSSRAVRTASENRPRNRTVRIWRKTAH